MIRSTPGRKHFNRLNANSESEQFRPNPPQRSRPGVRLVEASERPGIPTVASAAGNGKQNHVGNAGCDATEKPKM